MKNIVILIFLVVIIAAGATIWYVKEIKNVSIGGGVIKTAQPTATPQPTNQESSSVVIFNKIKEACIKGDLKMYKEYLTKESITTLDQMVEAGWTFTLPKDLTLVKENKINESKATIECIETDEDGNKEEVNYFFVKEGGAWKFDLKTTFEKMMEETPNGADQEPFADLAAMDIVVNPVSPEAGDVKTEIQAKIKNIGTSAIKETVNYKYKINDWEQTGSYAGAIEPGEIVRLEINYDLYLAMTHNTQPGDYAIYFEINYDNKVSEKSRENNKIETKIKFL